MTTELVLLGTAGAPLPVAGRAGISTALVVDGTLPEAIGRNGNLSVRRNGLTR
jgi:hypothetical protein